ncbi:MAG: DUF2868 domain-containing protein [Planctomycetota bacterium]
MARFPRPQPGTLIDRAVQLRRDEVLPTDTLRRRDRAVGQQLGVGPAESAGMKAPTRAGLITAWLSAVPGDRPRGGDALWVVSLLAVVIGVLLGYAAAMALFYYDGDAPVNVVNILAVFVGLQAVTLLLFGIAALPGGLTRTASAGGPGALPGGRLLRTLSPGRAVAWLAKRLPGETRDAVTEMLGRTGAHQRVHGRVQKWQVLAWSQMLALGFNFAAVGGALQLIVFSDLAFGWSTTLQADAEDMHKLTSAISSPWTSYWEDATPKPELVAATQTFRAAEFGGGAPEVAAREAAKWWPFLIAAMLFYGVLPRLVTVVVTQRRLRRAVLKAVAFTPGVDRVCDRLTAALVQTQGAEHEAAGPNGDAVAEAARPAAEVGTVISWAAASAGPAHDDALPAGGANSIEEDRAAIDEAARRGGVVRVVVKAWEPPILELLDFLRDLRTALRDDTVIEVMPVGDGDRAVWRKKLASVGDPWLRLVDASGGEGQR